MTEESSKLQHHLTLLRQEYVKLQTRYSELERKYNIAVAGKDGDDEDSFVSRLLKIVADLFDKELYSDLKIKLNGRYINAHKFVLAARSNTWSISNLSKETELDLSHISPDIGLGVIRWAYTDVVDLSTDDSYVLEMMKISKQFELMPLFGKCEQALITSVNVRNCIRFYQSAEEIGASSLLQHCSELLVAHWNDFTGEDFVHMTASLLYKMLKSKTEYPLHSAIKLRREDVVFLYLIEFTSDLPGKLNEQNADGDLPLDLALKAHQDSIAKSLVSHGVNVNVIDNKGKTLLHKAIIRLDKHSSLFLIENGASVNSRTPIDEETALHLLAKIPDEETLANNMQDVASALIAKSADPNMQDRLKNTVLHLAIANENRCIFNILMQCNNLKLELKNLDGQTALWFALLNNKNYGDDGLAAKLVAKGSSVNAVNPDTADSLLHLSAKNGLEDAGIFLVERKADINHINKKGESPLHLAGAEGLTKLVSSLLLRGANPNLRTSSPFGLTDRLMNMFGDEDSEVYQWTALQLTILNQHKETVATFIDHKRDDDRSNKLDLDAKNSRHQTALGLALLMDLHDVAEELIDCGAKMDVMNSDGLTMLHEAIMNQDTKSAIFLLNHKADINVKTKDGDTSLQLAIKRHLPVVVEALCSLGVDLAVTSNVGQCPLWLALDSGQEDIASILVEHGVDTDYWGEGPGGCHQTLLHRAIDENNDAVGCFLISSGCDVDATRRPSPDGRGEEEAHDKLTPLHLACTWGLELIVQSLVEHNANVNSQDVDGKTPLHMAIENQHVVIISLLLSHPYLDLTLRDKQGMTPFSVAMTMKNNKAAQGILDREATAAEQVDNKGRNFLHIAIQKGDIESVLFLISIHANVQSRIQDSSRLSPLHLAVQSGSEIIVRNLLLAGANINDITLQKQTALHIAAQYDHSAICSILIENNVDFDALDDNLNNALHIAVKQGNLAACRVLLSESQIQAEAVNLRGQNPLHILGQYGKENAAAIFELFMQCMASFPINKPDVDGNTPLLLAYMNGNGNLCRAIVKEGACLGSINRHGASIFNYQVATKQLLFRLLDSLSKEPVWSEGESCLECSSKFGITNRRHHCRHCGRLLCSKCSDKDMPVLKYNITKPVRVCGVCFDVLTLGSGP